jgi:23S rRNA (uracil-5-)-methyltransferase RumA
MDRRLTLTIERPVAGGRMLARHDGRVVLVSGAIPGETVVARVENVSRKVVFASTVDVVSASPDRRPPACDPACGGSVFAHIAIERQRALKADIVADALRRIGRLSVERPIAVAASPEHGYRLRGRLHVQHRRAGFFVERSHRLCDAGATRQFRADTLDAVSRLSEALGDHTDSVSSMLIAENVAATERVVHLEAVEGHDLTPRIESLALVDGLTGLTATSRGRIVALGGEGRVTDTADALCGDSQLESAGVRWTRTALSFFQGNRFLTGELLRRVVQAVRGQRVLDLYAGVGLFSVAMAAHGRNVLAVEGDDTSVGDLELNAAAWDATLSTRQSSVEAALTTMVPETFDTVVLDPPRTGASAEAIAGVIALVPSRVVYVSCDPATLARDAALLVSGGYRLVSVEAFDLFPNTAHVETMAVFDRFGSLSTPD